MALLTKNTGQNGTDFLPCPEGDFQAVVVDVCDLGWIEKTFEGTSQGLKPHVQLVFAIMDDEVKRDDGSPYLVFGRRQVLSTHERAGFYKEICSILGKKAVDSALESGTLDTEDLIGCNVRAVVVHNASKDGTKMYANLESVSPWNPKFGAIAEVPDTYVRRSDREDWNEKAPQHSAFGPKPVEPTDAELSAQTGNRASVTPRPNPAPVATTAKVPDSDPRMHNTAHDPKGAAKRILAEDDEPDIFDGGVEGGEFQPVLMDAPKKTVKNTAHS
jgi:hypothetical protein